MPPYREGKKKYWRRKHKRATAYFIRSARARTTRRYPRLDTSRAEAGFTMQPSPSKLPAQADRSSLEDRTDKAPWKGARSPSSLNGQTADFFWYPDQQKNRVTTTLSQLKAQLTNPCLLTRLRPSLRPARKSSSTPLRPTPPARLPRLPAPPTWARASLPANVRQDGSVGKNPPFWTLPQILRAARTRQHRACLRREGQARFPLSFSRLSLLLALPWYRSLWSRVASALL